VVWKHRSYLGHLQDLSLTLSVAPSFGLGGSPNVGVLVQTSGGSYLRPRSVLSLTARSRIRHNLRKPPITGDRDLPYWYQGRVPEILFILSKKEQEIFLPRKCHNARAHRAPEREAGRRSACSPLLGGW
jgi:hypothetical protein